MREWGSGQRVIGQRSSLPIPTPLFIREVDVLIPFPSWAYNYEAVPTYFILILNVAQLQFGRSCEDGRSQPTHEHLAKVHPKKHVKKGMVKEACTRLQYIQGSSWGPFSFYLSSATNSLKPLWLPLLNWTFTELVNVVYVVVDDHDVSTNFRSQVPNKVCIFRQIACPMCPLPTSLG
jgi:hypothetical protein